MPIPANLHLEIQAHRSQHYGIIRSSFRSNGKVKHSNHGRISGLPLDKLKLIQAAFRGDVVAKSSADAFQVLSSRESAPARPSYSWPKTWACRKSFTPAQNLGSPRPWR
jgi:hypothetical protein